MGDIGERARGVGTLYKQRSDGPEVETIVAGDDDVRARLSQLIDPAIGNKGHASIRLDICRDNLD